MRVMLDDMDLAVSEVECLSMGTDEREERSLGKIQHCWESISLHAAEVGHILLTTINANFLDK
jgi:hypothetical protein